MQQSYNLAHDYTTTTNSAAVVTTSDLVYSLTVEQLLGNSVCLCLQWMWLQDDCNIITFNSESLHIMH